MSIQANKMNQVEINRIQTLIEQSKEDNEVIEFEIIVDGLPAVKRTDNPERFSNYQRCITPTTTYIRIILYYGKSNNSNAFEFWMNAHDDDEALEMSLGDLGKPTKKSYSEKEREELIKNRKTKDTLAEENEQLKKELAELKAVREQREKYIASIEEAIEKFKANGNRQKIEIGEVLSLGLEAFLKRNANLFKDIPVLNGLAGLGDNAQENQQPQGEATFRKKGEPATEQPVTLTEEQKEFLRFFSDLQKLFSTQEMVQVFSILEALSRDKSKIQTVLELVR